MEKLNKEKSKAPSIDERRKRSYKLKVSLSHAYVNLCDKLNPTNSKFYMHCQDIIDRDETIELGWKDREMINYGLNGSVIRSISEDENEILEDFNEIFSERMDELLGIKPCRRG